jgi:hypothetical protein
MKLFTTHEKELPPLFRRPSDSVIFPFLVTDIYTTHIFCAIYYGLGARNFNFFVAFAGFTFQSTIIQAVKICL